LIVTSSAAVTSYATVTSVARSRGTITTTTGRTAPLDKVGKHSMFCWLPYATF